MSINIEAVLILICIVINYFNSIFGLDIILCYVFILLISIPASTSLSKCPIILEATRSV